ncbi:thioredoxin reductase [Candidatus Dependentiae bacterium Noda2021]|nr:thioredoxin reductase [Candidatus Dependentiae bacterium Noda2021]
MQEVHSLIIIGSGPAGLTAAIYASRANLKPIVVEGKKPGGQLMNTTAVENWPGNISIMGPELMINMRKHAEHFGTRFISGEVTQVSLDSKPFIVKTAKEELKAHCIIIATGANSKLLGCPGEQDYWNKGVSTCAVCDGAFFQGKKVVIVGGGDTAMEDASFMLNFTDDITIVHIKSELTASHAMQQRVLNNKKITIIYDTTVTSIQGDGNKVTGVTLTNQKTHQTSTLPTDAVFIAIGLLPNTVPFKGKIDLNDYGYLIVHDHTKTSVEGVFAAGDVFDYRYRQAITASGSGCMAALDAERYIKEHSV